MPAVVNTRPGVSKYVASRSCSSGTVTDATSGSPSSWGSERCSSTSYLSPISCSSTMHVFYPVKMNTSNRWTKIMSGAAIAHRRRTSAAAFRLRDLTSVPNPEDLTPPRIVQEARGIHDTKRPQGRRPQEDPLVTRAKGTVLAPDRVPQAVPLATHNSEAEVLCGGRTQIVPGRIGA